MSRPSATTSPYGRFGLTVRKADLALLSSMHVIVKPGTGCVDTSTGLPLAIRMKVAAPCGAKLNAVGMVNLITVGHAASGVHNGQREVDMGGSDGAVVMGGIKERAGIGFLTLFEYFKYVEVGSNLKMPKHPVWVVCSESHFTVLFASDARAARGALPCELRYYDGLARQDAPIVLTLERHPEGAMPPEDAPPLERVLSTRWGALCVGWNGTDPIL